MKFNLKKRYGPARIGKLCIDNIEILTPNIFYVNTSRFKAPDYANIVITDNKIKVDKPVLRIKKSYFSYTKLKIGDKKLFLDNKIYSKNSQEKSNISQIELCEKEQLICYIDPDKENNLDIPLKNISASFFIIGNAVNSFNRQSKFLEILTKLRSNIGSQKIIYLSCLGDPTSFALLTYMGIDLFDSIPAIQDARMNNLQFPSGKCNINDLEEIQCSCPVCNSFKNKPHEMDFIHILNHNYLISLIEIKKVRNALYHGNLRELVEIRVRANPNLTALLRLYEKNHYDFIEEKTPITRKNQLIATTKEALYRPEVTRFKKRLIKRYIKPKSVRILLLLPCSAKKPYSFSKSHRKFIEIINNLRNPNIIHEVIITSPLGIVPRELELTYPASKYDIPVTGFWYEDEKKMIRTLMKKYLEINHYEKFVIHLPNALRDLLKGIVKNHIYTVINNDPLSVESLRKLSDVLNKTIEPFDKIKSSLRIKENIKSLASYQFGRSISKELVKDCKVKGKYPYQKIMQQNFQVGMITKNRGLISLTLKGARIVADSGKYWVRISDDFILKGSVFAPGIKDADELIRIGDEVVILKNNKLCAIGIAQMNGAEMKESTNGEAIKTRHIL
jgi:archaeosine synthase